MADPQLEDGYTSIANEILEQLAKMPLAPNQWRVLICIIRKTYGFHRKVDYIANSQICDATGLCKAVVSRALHDLDQLGVINRKGKYIGFQKDWERWQKLAGQSNMSLLESRKIQKLRIIRNDGYIGIWHGSVEPKFQNMTTKQGYILEHRLIIARNLGRCLEPWEVVHHKDGVPSNNNQDNLELLPSQVEHMPSIRAKQEIKRLEGKLAELQTIVDEEKLAIPSSTVAESSTKVSSPAVAQKIKDTKQKIYIIPEWINKETWDAFLEMRKRIKAVPTDKAQELIIKELEKLKLQGHNPNEVLNMSIMNGWRGVFPLKGGQGGTYRGSSRQLRSRGSYTRPEDY